MELTQIQAQIPEGNVGNNKDLGWETGMGKGMGTGMGNRDGKQGPGLEQTLEFIPELFPRPFPFQDSRFGTRVFPRGKASGIFPAIPCGNIPGSSHGSSPLSLRDRGGGDWKVSMELIPILILIPILWGMRGHGETPMALGGTQIWELERSHIWELGRSHIWEFDGS